MSRQPEVALAADGLRIYARGVDDSSLGEAWRSALAQWDEERSSARLWERQAGLWTGRDEGEWLGWLDLPAAMPPLAAELAHWAEGLSGDFRHALLLGMGGSSLGPEVLATTLGVSPGFLDLEVLDSLHPDQIRSRTERLDLARTLVVVSSKSGGTLETRLLLDYFADRLGAVGGKAGAQLVAITDPGSGLEERARRERFRRVVYGEPSVGGRFSVLSAFGLVPAALLGIDCAELLERTRRLADANRPGKPAAESSAVALGLLLAVAAETGRDKVTLLSSPSLRSFGAWLEQLLAESTGKVGAGLLPVDGEALGAPAVYGDDRLFLSVALAGESQADAERRLETLSAAGHPVVAIELRDRYDLGRELFRFELATAVAGARLRVHPFDQPDVEASKVATRELTDGLAERGALPVVEPCARGEAIDLFSSGERGGTPAALIESLLGGLAPGGYASLLAYLESTADTVNRLQKIRHRVRDRLQVATAVGFGPRYLHSTGQAYKGGPAGGRFLVLTADPAADLPVPGSSYSFAQVLEAQARADAKVMAERGRAVLRCHLRGGVEAGLAELESVLVELLA